MENLESTKTGVTQDNISNATTEGVEKTYTQAEVDILLQTEADRRVTSALKKQAQKFAQEKAEAEKLRDMDDAQKKEYEYEKKMQELAKKEKDFNLAQNKLEASKVMSEHGLPISFVDYIVAEDAETMMSNINTFETLWKTAMNEAVSARLAQPAPKSSSVVAGGITKEQFNKMSVQQQAELYRTQPELYKQLTLH